MNQKFKGSSEIFMGVEEVMQELMVSKTTAYQTIKKSNEVMQEKGLPIRPGKMRRDYFKKMYRTLDYEVQK